MQKKVQIVSDGSLDLPQELTREKDIEVVPFYVSFDSETYKKEVVEIGIRDFYQEMVDHPPRCETPLCLQRSNVAEDHHRHAQGLRRIISRHVQQRPGRGRSPCLAAGSDRGHGRRGRGEHHLPQGDRRRRG